jgi:hypothetical protein
MDQPIVATEVRRKVLLGIEATYCVADVSEDIVIVEALRVPGLAPGTRVRMTAEAVAEMELVEPMLDVDREVGLLLDAA